MFTDQDLKQIESKGITQSDLERQIGNFKRGFPFVNLIRPATVGDGIFSFRDDEHFYFTDYFTKQPKNLRVMKFVPASGAATRMFKHLFEFPEVFQDTPAARESFLQENDFNSVAYLVSHLPQIAFYPALQQILAGDNLDARELIESWLLDPLFRYILEEKGLNYALLPKGLILFHNYPEGARTAAEEHLVEAATYACNNDRTARIHFTISPEHRSKFQDLFDRVKERYESQFGISFLIGFSEQLPSTDTLAVDEENNPFRNAEGSLLFRPAGHGALLKNLNRLDADIIFVKNIDNIVPDRLKPTTFEYKRLLGGYLLYLRDHINCFLAEANEHDFSGEEISNIVKFIEHQLQFSLPGNFSRLSLPEKQKLLMNLLDRPIRVCGMVQNEGEPGGGPFWVRNSDGTESLQIVESSQIDLDNPEQRAMVEKATHFNPVDLVCSIRNHHGEPFDLQKYVDEEAGLISLKSSGGRKLKAQELPGLWNGAMARWITVFVEIPIITFNPVKTVNDLLRKEHLEK